MGKESNIDIFLRIRPVKQPSANLQVDTSECRVSFNLPKDAASGIINNQREHYEYRFNGILEPESKQDEVFERVARSVVVGALDGFNGTIFAYGQTGSGKTFTITGGAERYVDRGIIPRSLSFIFGELAKRSDSMYTVHISYLEIYNEVGYDLLDPDREIKAMEDLQQVYMMEDEDSHIHFRNLSVHRATNEEEALNLLFLGDTNRTISETPMNQASTRSHCIFTIYIEARKTGEETLRRSKLNLVDLAGSERVSKTGVEGLLLKEAKYINLSLHYLEQVIIALQERSMGKGRPHIPYRNSMMTMVLKDSLGGNCRTTMVATMNPDRQQLDESISTCRFAQRVAMIRNEVSINEELDPEVVIRRLKQEVRDLKEEVRLLSGQAEDRGPLTPDELLRLRGQIEAYCGDQGTEAGLNLGGSMLFIRAALDLFRTIVREGGSVGKAGAASGAKQSLTPGKASSLAAADSSDLQEQVEKLRLQVQQRDNEISILVSMLKKRQASGADAPALLLAASSPSQSIGDARQQEAGPLSSSGTGLREQPASSPLASNPPGLDQVLLDTSLLADRNRAFEVFRKSYRQNEVIEENKSVLRHKYDAAKAIGQEVSRSKARILELKGLVEQRRVQRAMAGLSGQAADSSVEDPDETRAKDMIEKEKEQYKASFDKLRELKKEIEHVQMLLEQSRVRLQRDFEQWMGMCRAAAASAAGAPTTPGGQPVPSPSGRPPGGMPSPTPSTSRLAAAAAAAAAGATRASNPAFRPASPVGASGTSPHTHGSGGTPPPHASTSRPSTQASASRRGTQVAVAAPGPGAGQLAGVPAVTAPRVAWGEQPVDPAVLEAARPYLTGNAEADRDIIRFHEARAKLLQNMGQR